MDWDIEGLVEDLEAALVDGAAAHLLGGSLRTMQRHLPRRGTSLGRESRAVRGETLPKMGWYSRGEASRPAGLCVAIEVTPETHGRSNGSTRRESR
jgi:hypothetical protein